MAPEIIWNLGAVYIPIMGVITLIVVTALLRFPIDRNRHEANLALLRERTAEIEEDQTPAPLVNL